MLIIVISITIGLVKASCLNTALYLALHTKEKLAMPLCRFVENMKVFKSRMLATELNPFVRLGENYPDKLLYKKANFTYTTVLLLYLVCISNSSRWFSYIAVAK